MKKAYYMAERGTINSPQEQNFQELLKPGSLRKVPLHIQTITGNIRLRSKISSNPRKLQLPSRMVTYIMEPIITIHFLENAKYCMLPEITMMARCQITIKMVLALTSGQMGRYILESGKMI